MNKTKIIMLVSMLVIMVLSFLGTFYLGSTGVLDSEILGLKFIDFILIIMNIVVGLIALYDFLNIQLNKRKYGKLRFVMKRTSKKTQVIGLIFLVCIFTFQAILYFVILNEAVSIINGSMIFLIGMMALIFAFHNIEKEGLADECVYFWGTPIQWSNITSYSIDEGKLTLYISRKVLGRIENTSIIFIIENSTRENIESYLAERPINQHLKIRQV